MRVLFPTLFVLSIAFAPGCANAQRQTVPIEQRLVQNVDKNNDGALALLERVVNINSGTMNNRGVREVGRVFAAEFEALGLKTRWVDGEAFGRAGHLVAARQGRGPHILLIGHLDTVFETDSPFQEYERLSESSARGPGVIDMKGGNVIIVYALKALREAGLLDDMTITVILIGDEERAGRPVSLAREALTKAADAADIAIAFENGDNDPHTAVIARRGSTQWRLRVTGKPGHSSQVFRDDVGAGAIYEASRIIHNFYDRLAGEPFLTFNPGLIMGGTSVDYDKSQSRGTVFGKNNVIAEHTVVSGDLRTVSLEQLEDAKRRMRGIVDAHLPHTSAEITFDDSYPPMAPSDGNKKLLAILDKTSQDLGLGSMTAVDPMKAGAADISFTAGRVEMGIDGLGLVGKDCHAVGETADLSTLPIQTKRAAVLLYRLSQRR